MAVAMCQMCQKENKKEYLQLYYVLFGQDFTYYNLFNYWQSSMIKIEQKSSFKSMHLKWKFIAAEEKAFTYRREL